MDQKKSDAKAGRRISESSIEKEVWASRECQAGVIIENYIETWHDAVRKQG